MAAVVAAKSTACARCGAALETTSSADFGCMVCMLQLAFEKSPAAEAEHFGQYVIEKREDGHAWELGRGAMGVTYRAIDTSLRRVVALKLIKADFAGRGSDARERFMREARATAALRHPNVATVYQSGIDEETGQCFYAMELVEGETLDDRVRRSGPLDARTVIEIARQITAALGAAEKRGLVHRDLKPANVMIATGDEGDNIAVKVIDFGLAKALAETPDVRALTRGEFIGTPAFASPEQFTDAPVDVRSDIYSLGATLWYLLTGHMPFGDRAGSAAPPTEQLKAAHVSARLTTLMLSMLAIEPAARPGVRELAAKLELISGEAKGRQKWPLRIALAAAVVALAAGVAFLYRSRSETRTAPEKSVAVLPFADLSENQTDAYFASGIQDAILTRLSKIADLKVISRTSTEQIKSAPSNLRDIAKSIGAANILEGSVQRAGDQIRISVQLIQAESDSHLWAETYDRRANDVLQVESEVAEHVASSLEAKLTGRERHEIATVGTTNPQAYDMYLHGLALQRSDSEDVAGSIEFYRKAVELDPNFALAWAKLGCRESDTLPQAGMERAEHLSRAQTAVNRALRLRPDLGESHTAAGLLYYEQRDLEHALAEFEQARSRSPNDSEVPFFISLVKRRQGKWGEAIELQREALNLDPLNFEIRINLARSYRSLRRFAEARDAIDRSLAVKPNDPDALWMKAETYSAEGNIEEAERLLNEAPNEHIPMVGGSLLFGRYIPLCISRGKFDEAIARIETELQHESTLSPAMVAIEHARMAQIKFYAGDSAETRSLLEQARRDLKAAREVLPVRLTLIETNALLGLRDEMEQEAKAFLQSTANDLYVAPIAKEVVARGYAILGDADQAIPLLEHALAVPYFEAITPACLRFDPAWDRMRTDPRFEKLLEPLNGQTAQATAEKSVAVLPFDDLGDDKTNAYFASGIHDDLLVNLSKIRDLKVIARESVLPYKGSSRNLPEIGKTLGVTAVVQGSVRRAGTRARVNVQLLDAATGGEIWADNFDREITDVFAIQSDLALQVASALKATLSPMESAGIKRQPTENAQAYLLYVRANDLFAGHMKARPDLEKAEKLFQEAVGLDPKFALALAQLSQLETIFSGYDPTPARVEKARVTAEEALRLQPDLPEAHMAMGRYYWQGQKHRGEMDLAGALREFQAAERGLPGSAEIKGLIARVERQQGKWMASLAGLEKAAALDPNTADRWHRIYYGNLALRRYPEAAKALDRAIALSPNSWLFELHRAWLQVQWKGDVSAIERLRPPAGPRDDPNTDWIRTKVFLGRYDEAEKVVRDDPRPEIPWNGMPAVPKSLLLGNINFAKKDRAKAREYYEAALPEVARAVHDAPLNADRHMVLADVYAGLDRKEEAIREGKRACELLPESKDAWFGVWMADDLADLYVEVGEPELALTLLGHSLSVPAGKHIARLRIDPLWEPLRSNPRFQKLIASATNQNAEAENSSAGKSIAVLPFENLSENKEDALLVRGLQDDLLVSLSKIEDLKVISRGSVIRYQEGKRDLAAIGKALGVNAVLEGTFWRHGEQAQINVQLIDPATGEQIWAENYERETKDLLSLQRDLAARITFALKAKVTPRETTRLQRRPTENGDAYLFYLQANDISYAYDGDGGDLKRAEELLEKAIALDPSFALAFARLSQVETKLHSGYDPVPARRIKAKAAADEALRLQPDLPEAHLALGRYYWIGENSSGEADYEKAMRELTIALRGLPSDPEALSQIGRVERHLGKWEESTAHLAKAAALDPNNEERWHRLYYNYYETRNYAAAWQALDRAIALAPDSWQYQTHRAYLQLFWKADPSALEEMLTRPPSGEGPQGFMTQWRFQAALSLGKYKEAEQTLQANPQETFTVGWLTPIPKSFLFGQLYTRIGDIAKARANFEKARPSIEQTVQQRPLEGAWHLVLAEVYAGLGRKEDAIREGKRATEIMPEAKDPWAGVGMLDGLAQIYVLVGEPDLAIPILEHSLASPGGMHIERLRDSPFWRPLRGNPRFEKLLSSAPGPNTSNKSIAVLPFENLSEDKSSDYLASGIHGDLLANLSRLGQLKVISGDSVLPYKGTRRNLREIGNELGARTVLKGTVQRAASRTRINVQLIDATNGRQIWAESFDREVRDIFSVQSDLAARIAGALEMKLSPAERAAIERPPTRDAEAYDFYLRGRELLDGITSLGNREENLSNAIELLNRAVARDPNFALGYCFLARLHLARFRLSGRDPARLEPVRSNLAIALRLAPDLGEAHLVKGMYFYWGVVDYKSASAEFAIARGALPDNAECFHLSGLLERRLGRWRDGLHDLRKAISLDPKNSTAREDLGSTYYLTRNFAEADSIFDEAIVALPEHANYFRAKEAKVALIKGDLEGCRSRLQSLPPDYEYDGFVGAYRSLLALYLRDFAGAERVLAEALAKLGPKNSEWWVVRNRAFVARAEGDTARTKVAFETALRFWESELRSKKPDDPEVLCTIAQFHAGLGRKEEALREAHRAVELRPLAADAIDGPAFATIEALVYAWCGERDLALKQLASLARLPSGPDPGDLKFNPAWDALRGDPRLDAVIAAASEPIKIE